MAILSKVRHEPAMLISIVGAIITLLIAYGIDISQDQQAAISGLLFLLVGGTIRSQVSPVDKDGFLR